MQSLFAIEKIKQLLKLQFSTVTVAATLGLCIMVKVIIGHIKRGL